MIYTYKCSVKDCNEQFDIECSLSEHKDIVDCPYCESKLSAKQQFITDFNVVCKKSSKRGGSQILNQITWDKE